MVESADGADDLSECKGGMGYRDGEDNKGLGASGAQYWGGDGSTRTVTTDTTSTDKDNEGLGASGAQQQGSKGSTGEGTIGTTDETAWHARGGDALGDMDRDNGSLSASGAQQQGDERRTRMKTGRHLRMKRTSYGTNGTDLHVTESAFGAHCLGRRDERKQDRRKQGALEARHRRWNSMSKEFDWGCEAGDRGD